MKPSTKQGCGMIEFKGFSKETFADALAVARKVFGSGIETLLDKILSNPYNQSTGCSDAGEIAYLDGMPVGFNATIPRYIYKGKDPVVGVVGSTLALLPEARKGLVIYDLMQRTTAQKQNAFMLFGNSANKDGMRINKAFGFKGIGPNSCACKRVAVVRWIPFICYIILSKIFKRKINARGGVIKRSVGHAYRVRRENLEIIRIQDFDEKTFSLFWNEYLQHNSGYVCSRTPEELQWMFGGADKASDIIIVGAFDKERLLGYIVFTHIHSSCAWRVSDLIAQKNDLKVLSALMDGGVQVLKRSTSAVFCEISGFPDFVQPIIAKKFNMERILPNNQFCWKLYGNEDYSKVYSMLNSKDSWFFGPYDGDRCMCS